MRAKLASCEETRLIFGAFLVTHLLIGSHFRARVCIARIAKIRDYFQSTIKEEENSYITLVKDVIISMSRAWTKKNVTIFLYFIH